MKQSKTIKKRSLTASVIVLCLCVAALIGGTFAWFTDTASTGVNKIVAGTLKVDLIQRGGVADAGQAVDSSEAYTSIKNSSAAIFGSSTTANAGNLTLWEPGATHVAYLGVRNLGTLALKYNIVINVKDEGLASALEYAIVPQAKLYGSATCTNTVASWEAAVATAGASTGTFEAGDKTYTAATNGCLDEIAYNSSATNETDYFALVVHMKEEAGNVYQNKDVVIDVSVVASQATAESDSFDNQYDSAATAPYVATTDAITAEVNESQALKTSGDIKTADIASSAVNAVFNEMKSSNENASNELILTLNVVKQNETTSEVDAGTQTILDLSIDMSATMKSTVEGVATTATKALSSLEDYSTITMNIGEGLSDVVAKHNGVTMVNSTETTDDAGQGVYSYNSSTGVLTLKTKTFSPFTITYTKPADVKISKAGEADVKMTLAAFRDSVNEGTTYEDYTVTLLHNVDLGNVEWTPIGLKDNSRPFKGTFDGGNYTISGLSITKDPVVAFDGAKAEDYAALFGQVTGGTVKNLTVSGVVSASNAAGVVARFDGGTISNVTSNVTVTGVKKAGGITILAQDGATFNSCVNKGTVTLNASGSNRCIGGVVAMVNSPVTVANCVNEAAITCTGGSAQYLAGIVGYYQTDTGNATLRIDSCTNKGSITCTSAGSNIIGGIVGKVGKSAHTWTGYLALKNCRNEGTVQGDVDIIGSIADVAASGSYSGPYKPGTVKVYGTLTVRTGKKVCGNYNLVYNRSETLESNPVSEYYVNPTPTTEGGYDIYTGVDTE